MPIKAELMQKHELEGIRERYDIMPEMTQRLLRHEQWLQEMIRDLRSQSPSEKAEAYFQRREKQRKEYEMGL